MTQAQLQNAQNFLVPAMGTTRMYTFKQTMAAGEVYEIDFRDIGLDGRPFVPYSAIIDNSLGTGVLTISILDVGYRVFCPAGGTTQQMYPAPFNQKVALTGEGDVVVVFTDYPVMPINSQINITPAQITAITDLLQELVDKITDMATVLDAVNTSTGEINTKLTTTNSLLNDIKTNTTP